MLHIKGFKPVAVADSGNCDRCGTLCPKERVVMAAVDQDGLIIGDMTENWGRCCAAQYCYKSKSAASVAKVMADVSRYQQDQEYVRQSLLRRVAKSGDVTWKETRSTGSGFTYLETVTIHMGDKRAAANKIYAMTGLPREGSYFMESVDGDVVRARDQERKFYEDLGFAQTTIPAQ